MITDRELYWEREFKLSQFQRWQRESLLPPLKGCQQVPQCLKSRNGFKDPPAAPLETRTRGRIYVTIGKSGQPKAITYYDKHGRRKAQIDLDHMHKGEKPHKHGGYNHNRDLKMTKLDKWLVRHVEKLWKEHKND